MTTVLHPHDPYRHHHGHNHAHPRQTTHRHTVIHAIRTAHPPHHHEELRTRNHLVTRPRIRQYFSDDGDLHKQCDDGIPRQAGKFELFLDLLYIGLCANFAQDCIHHPNTEHLWKYILIFVPAWRIWTDLTNVMNMYYNDDIIQRFLIAWIMILMMLFGNNATYIDISLPALQTATGAYIVARASIAIINLYYSITAYQLAFQLRCYNTISLLILPLWTPLFLPSISTRSKIAVAIFAFGSDHLANMAIHNKYFRRYFNLKYSAALDIDHEVDRMAAFYIIVLGEFLYGLVWASPAALSGVHGPFGRAAISLIIAFCLCWLYTASDGSRENPVTGVHALRWKISHALQWIMLHLPLSASLLIAGDICAVFVRYGHDEVGIETRKRAEETFPATNEWQALRWMFCEGLAIGLVCLYWIALLHHEVDEDEETRHILFMRYHVRRSTRLPVAAVIAFLPMVGPEKMSIMGLMGTVTGLLGFSVVWEMVGGLEKGWTVLEVGKDRFCDEEAVEAVIVSEDDMVVVVEEEGKECETLPPKSADAEKIRAERRGNDQSAEVEIFEGVRNVVAAREGECEHGLVKCL
ncbi:hypothetical protein BDD12DRAFT_982624 [Trichophaea hybrida]|nr:hypothetical protein BDD12DRAFT_982624 [Trichophaea hybrida]